ncbi:MAG: LytR C-terminal domain-containing protein, partial [Candidatus Paceibacterota bacterium]
ETVKTLKGAEPNIQTLYLLSSALVENKLKDGLKGTLPIQQLADDSEESEMPSYIKQVAEAGAKTLSVADYKIPVFTIGVGKNTTSAANVVAVKEAMPDKTPAVTDLPTPSTVGEDKTKPELEFADEAKSTDSADDQPEAKETPSEDAKSEESTEPEVSEPELVKPEDVDLSQFSSKEEPEEEEKPEAKEEPKSKKEEPEEKALDKATPPVTKEEPTKTVSPAPKTVSPAPKAVIKNDRGTHSMMKMIFIGLASFFVTVGIGLGIGLGLLTFTQSDETTEPTSTAEVIPSPEPTPTPTPTPEINRADYKVKVVNATTKAGYASEIADLLETAGFESVAAGNALGDYEPGNYVLLAEEDQALTDLLSKDTELELVYAPDKEVEDAAEAYTIIIVLAE